MTTIRQQRRPFLKAASDARFQRVRRRQERDFRRIALKLFAEQMNDIRKRVNQRLKGWTGSKADPLPFDLSSIFTAAAWTKRFVDLGRPAMARSMAAGASSQVDLFSLVIDLDIIDLPFRPVPAQWLNQRAEFWAVRTNGATSQLIARAHNATNIAQEGIPGFAKRLENIGRFNNEVRSFRAARTETVAATNQGHLEAYREAEIPGKEWRTSRDPRVRPLQEGDDPRWDHVAADGQVVGLDDAFIVSGESLPAPGQGGSPGNVINCRCNVLPVFSI